MAEGFSKKYGFAAISSLYVSGLLTICIAAFLVGFSEIGNGWIFIFALVAFFISFFIIQYRIEKFVFKRVKYIYEDIRLLDQSDASSASVTTDMNVLTQEMEQFARDKKLEIETLKIRENYRKEFMGNISHELKTPLFTVQGYILTLLDGALKDKKVRKKYLKNANKGVERLIYIVKDLDMITKLEVGDLNLNKEEFDILKLIKDVFELLDMKAGKKSITLTFDREYSSKIYVYADRERIQQVLTNLIVNSIKYGKETGTTEVSIEKLVKNKIIVRVTDNGEGIDKQNLRRIFERFFRVDKSGSRKEGGSGLGLSIVKHIVEAHKEKIYVESQLGIGSEFSFTLENVEKTA